MSTAQDRKWAVVSERHTLAVNQFLEAANSLPADQWLMPVADGKWTPAQITLHVAQAYDVITKQMRTGEGLRVQTGWLTRQVLRLVVLRPIMWTRKLPKGAKAPRTLIPGDVTTGRDESLEQLRASVAAFEGELSSRRQDPGLQMTHHIFGSVDGLKGLDFIAVHTEHHCRQLRSCGEARPSA